MTISVLRWGIVWMGVFVWGCASNGQIEDFTGERPAGDDQKATLARWGEAGFRQGGIVGRGGRGHSLLSLRRARSASEARGTSGRMAEKVVPFN